MNIHKMKIIYQKWINKNEYINILSHNRLITHLVENDEER